MEAQHLDDLAREIGSQLPRRSVLGALGGLAALLALPALESEARKKKHGKPRRGRKKCKGNKKKCGKKCIPTDQCCTKADCGPTQTCTNGTCTCPDNLTQCGSQCIESGLCCPNGDCPAGQSCDGSTCWCNAADGIWCDAECCDGGADEVCASTAAGPACAAGGCQVIDWCNVRESAVCRDSPSGYCVCITSYDGVDDVPACVDELTLGESCDSCETNDECDDGYVCVQGDTSEEGYCGCSGKFCARLCDAEPERAPGSESAGARISARKEKPGRARERRSR